MDNFKIFITEAGLDLVTSERWELPMKNVDDKPMPFSGWRTCAPYWKRYFSDGAPHMYGRLLQWMDDYYHQFEQVAVIVFGLGPHHNNDFEDFDIGGNNQTIIQMMLDSNPTSEVVAPPIPKPPPLPDPTSIPTPDPTPQPLPDPTPLRVLSRRQRSTILRLMSGIKKRQEWVDIAEAKIKAIYASPKKLQ